MKKIFKFLDEYLEMLLCVPILAVMSSVIFLQVIMRHVFSSSLSWSEELACYLFVWLIFLATSYAIREGKHMRVDVLINALPQKIGLFISLLQNVLFFAFTIMLVWYGFKVVSTFVLTGQRAPGIGVPAWLLYFSLPIGMLMSSVRLIQSLIHTIKEMLKDSNKEGEE